MRPVLTGQPWLSGLFGKPCFTLAATGIDDFAVPEQSSFIDARIPLGDSRAVSVLIAHGFRLVTVDVQLVRDAGLLEQAGEIEVRPAIESDSVSVGEIAGTAFVCDRFHADPDVDAQLANRIKREWALNYFNGQRGDEMAIASIDGQVAGFNLLIKRPDRLVIDLIAIAPKFQRRGIGRAMIAFAIERWGAGCPTLVGTQLSNIASMRLYESMEFRMSSASYTFHRHGTPN